MEIDDLEEIIFIAAHTRDKDHRAKAKEAALMIYKIHKDNGLSGVDGLMKTLLKLEKRAEDIDHLGTVIGPWMDRLFNGIGEELDIWLA